MREQTYSISGAVLFYGMACTLLISIGLAVMLGWTNYNLTRDLTHIQADTQAAWEEVQAARTNTAAANSTLAACRLELVRYEAKLGIYDDWIKDANKARGMGGR